MKFIHTADWQIGMKAVHVGAVGQKVREVRLETARLVVEEANKHKVDFLILAGDTFEDNAVDRVLVQKVADILAEYGGPVYVIPGNHDPLVPGSVWQHPAWEGHQSIFVLRESEVVEFLGAFLYPCPAREKHSRRDPTSWIDASKATGIRIGIAHGTVEGLLQDDPSYPIPRDTVTRTGLDYLALGHWHSSATYEDSSGVIRMAYAGTHEATKFGERDSGKILLVEIREAGAPPKVQQLRTGRLNWVQINEEVGAEGDLVKIRERAEALENPQDTLLEILVSGLLAASDSAEFARLNEVISSRFLFARIDTTRLRPMPKDDRWVHELPPGVVREAAYRLQALSSPEYADPRPEGASPEVAAQALLQLYAMAEEVNR